MSKPISAVLAQAIAANATQSDLIKIVDADAKLRASMPSKELSSKCEAMIRKVYDRADRKFWNNDWTANQTTTINTTGTAEQVQRAREQYEKLMGERAYDAEPAVPREGYGMVNGYREGRRQDYGVYLDIDPMPPKEDPPIVIAVDNRELKRKLRFD